MKRVLRLVVYTISQVPDPVVHKQCRTRWYIINYTKHIIAYNSWAAFGGLQWVRFDRAASNNKTR